jgi:hypothetical protein
VLLPSNNKERLGVVKMILNTTNLDNHQQNHPALYTAFDPKYFYPEYKNRTLNSNYSQAIPVQHNDNLGVGIEDLMEQRRDIINKKLHMVVSEIYQRYRLKNENLYQICLDQCTCQSLIYDMGSNTWDRKRVEFERKIIDLEQEKRREKAGYFRDILFLKKELRQSLIEKLEEENKASFFTTDKEESI